MQNINRLISDELFSNDWRVEKQLTTPKPEALPTRLSDPYCFYAATDFILATSFTSEWEQ